MGYISKFVKNSLAPEINYEEKAVEEIKSILREAIKESIIQGKSQLYVGVGDGSVRNVYPKIRVDINGKSSYMRMNYYNVNYLDAIKKEITQWIKKLGYSVKCCDNSFANDINFNIKIK